MASELVDGWLLLGAEVGAGARDLGEVELGPYVLQRVAGTDPALGGAVDPRWSLAEILLLRRRASATRWEERTALEFMKLLEEDVGTTAREVRLLGEPITVPSTYRAPSLADLDMAGWEAWLTTVRDARGHVQDPELRDALSREHDLDDDEDDDEDDASDGDAEDGGAEDSAALLLARVRAKPDDLDLLVRTTRELLGAELPSDYLDFLREIGAMRIELSEEGHRTSLGTVLLPAKAVVQALDGPLVRSLRENTEGDYVPFFQFGDEHYAFDMGSDPASVVRLPEAETTHPSFRDWLAAWRDAKLAASEIQQAPITAPRLATRAAFERCWERTASWVRPLYEPG